MEATGSYHEPLACHLSDRHLHVSVVNPLQVKRFAEVHRQRNKTDAADAKCLALFCRDTSPEPWEATTPGVRALQALVARRDTLQSLQQAERNRQAVAHDAVDASIAALLAQLQHNITQVEAQIARTIDEDAELRQHAQLLQTIAGLGVNADLNLTHFPSDRRSKSDPPGVFLLALLGCAGRSP